MVANAARANVASYGSSTSADCQSEQVEDMPTPGQLAERIYDYIVAILRQNNKVQTNAPSSRNEQPEVALVQAIMSLLQKVPEQAREQFNAILPFSGLENLVVQETGWQNNQDAVQEVTERVNNWINRSPVFVEETDVHVVQFLERLEPFLDLWRQREDVRALVQNMHRANELR